MSNVTRFEPFADLVRFDPFHAFEALGYPRTFWRNLPQEPQITMDLSEDEKAFRVKAELPGVKKEDIKISIDGNQVSISAEVKKEKEEKTGEKVVRSERYYGSQYRRFTLQQEIDESRAEAKYEDGVLELVLPKKETTSAREITVK